MCVYSTDEFNLCISQPGTVLYLRLLNAPNVCLGHLLNAPNTLLGSSGEQEPFGPWKKLFSLSHQDTTRRTFPRSIWYTHFKCFHIGPNNDLQLSYTQLLTLIEHLAESAGGDGVHSAEEPSVLVTGAIR